MSSPTDFYLTVDGIGGGVAVEGYVGAFVVSSFQFDIGRLFELTSGGGSASGKADFSPLAISLPEGAHFNGLMDAIALGLVLPSVQLEGVVNNDGNAETVYDLRLGNVQVTRVTDTNGGDYLEFSYGQITLTTWEVPSNGGPSVATTFGFDIEVGESLIDPLPEPIAGMNGGGSSNPTRFLLTVSGMDGGGVTDGYEGAFDVDSFQFDIARLVELSGGGGASSGKADFSPLIVNLSAGANLTYLLDAVARGLVLPNVQIEGVVFDDGNSNKIYDLRLGNVQISRVTDRNGQDSLEFSYGQVTLTTTKIPSNGGISVDETFGFDVETGQSLTTPIDEAQAGTNGGSGVNPTDFYLTVSGMDGGVDLIGYERAFNVSDFQFDVGRLAELSAGTASAPANFSPLIVYLPGGAHLNGLLDAVARGLVLPRVQLEGVASVDGGDETVYDLRLGNVQVNRVTDTNGADYLEFSFEQVTLTTFAQLNDGSLSTPDFFGYDVANNLSLTTQLSAAVGGTNGGSSGPTEFYLTVSDIEGGSANGDYQGSFEVSGFQFDVSRLAELSGGGTSSGKADFSPLVVSLSNGAHLNGLLDAAALGLVLPLIRLEGVITNDGSQQTVYDLRLGDVQVTRVTDTNGVDTLEFSYKKVTLTTTEVSSQGSASIPETFGFDIEAGLRLTNPLEEAEAGTNGSGGSNPTNFYLTVSGMDGGSDQIDYLGAFDVFSFQFDVAWLAGMSGGGGAGFGQAQFSPLVVSLPAGAHLNGLLDAVALGLVLPNVQLEGTVTGGNGRPQTVYDLRLGNVQVTSVTDSNGSDYLAFSYGQVTLTTWEQAIDGSLSNPQTFGFDLVNNQSLTNPLDEAVSGMNGGSSNPTDFYLTVSGMDGGSTTEGYECAFNVTDFLFDIGRLVEEGGGTGGAGSADFSPLRVSLPAGANLNDLLDAAARGLVLPIVQLEGAIIGGSGRPQTVYDLRLGDVQVTRVTDTSGEDFLEFSYGKITLTTTEVSPDGSFSTSETFGFDVETGERLTSPLPPAKPDPVRILDFSTNGIAADFDNDPNTPDAPANGLNIVVTDDPDGGTVSSSSAIFQLSAFAPTPSDVTTIIGADIDYNLAVNIPNSFENRSSRDISFVNSSGDARYVRNAFSSGSTSFDGNSDLGSQYSFAAVDIGRDGSANLDLLNLDANGYGTLTTTWSAGTSVDKVKDVLSYRFGDLDDVVTGGDVANNIVNFALGGGDDTFIGGLTSDYVTGQAGNNLLDGGIGGEENQIEFRLYGSYLTYGVTVNMLQVDAEGYMNAVTEGAAYDFANFPNVGPRESFTTRFKNFQILDGTEGNDTFIGNGDTNRFVDDLGEDTISTGNGGDQVVLGNDGAHDSVTLGAGNNLVLGNVPTGVPADAGIDTLFLRGTRQDYNVELVATTSPVYFDFNGGQTGYFASSGSFITMTGLGALAAEGTDYIDKGVIERFVFLGADGTPNTADDRVFTETQLLALNTPPVAVADTVVVQEDQSILFDPKLNDSDVDGDALAITNIGIAPVLAGQVFVGIENNQIRITPAPNWNGSFSFNYTVSDGKGGESTANVNVDVQSVNDAPVAVEDQFFQGTEDIVLEGTLLASDADFNTLTFRVLTGPTNGSLQLDTDGSFTYQPNANANGADSFTYEVDDGFGGVITRNAKINLAAVNDNPVAQDDLNAVVQEDGTLLLNVLGNDSDVDGDALAITNIGIAPVLAGQVSVSIENNQIRITPAPNWNGSFSFNYTVSDGKGGESTANVNVDVQSVNDAPVAVEDQFFQGTEDTVLEGTLLASDADFNTLTFRVLTGPTNGSLQLDTDGSFTYQPNANANGADSFTYQVDDGFGGIITRNAKINLAAVNDAPTALNFTGGPIAENSANGTVIGTLAAVDPDAGDSFTYSLVSGSGNADNGLVSIVGNQIRVNGAIDFETNPTLDLRVRATDAGGLSFERTLTINVTDVIEGPPVNVINGTAGNDSQQSGAPGGFFGSILSSLFPEAFRGLRGTAGVDRIDGQGGDDVLFGFGGGDTLIGGTGNDTLYGDTAGGLNGFVQSIFFNTGVDGNDNLSGGTGNDSLFGGGGNDVLNGGTGRDELTGGAGADLFLFDDGDSLRTQRDSIGDFSRAEGDRIDLSLIDGIPSTAADDPLQLIADESAALAAVGSVYLGPPSLGVQTIFINTAAGGGFEMAINVRTGTNLLASDLLL